MSDIQELFDIDPKPVTFSIHGIELTFRPFTIRDSLRGIQLCGTEDEYKKAWETQNMRVVSRLAWHQLDLESQKRVISSVEAYTIDPDTGKETLFTQTPIEKFQHLFKTQKDVLLMYIKINACKGVNLPDLKDDTNLGEWMTQVQKKLAGLRSLIY